MEKFQEQSQCTFTLLSSLSIDDYRLAESMFKKNEAKNCSIYHQKIFLDKLQFIYEQDVETYSLFQKESNFNLEIPQSSNPELIPLIIHYLYFKEVQAIPFGEIVNFLHLAMFFQIKGLVQEIINFLTESIDTAKKAVFLRVSLYFLIKKTDYQTLNFLKEIFKKIEHFLLTHNHMKEYFSLYSSDQYIEHNPSVIESDMFNGLEMMKKHKINGKHMLKLIFLFKDDLNMLKKNDFNLKIYVQKIILKYVDLNEINTSSLIKSFLRLGLNLQDYKNNLSNEKIIELENEVKNIKEM